MIVERLLLTAVLLLVARWLWVSDVMAPWNPIAQPSDVYGATVLMGLFGLYGNVALIALALGLLWMIWAGGRK